MILSNCDLALSRGDVPAAVAMLSQVPPLLVFKLL